MASSEQDLLQDLQALQAQLKSLEQAELLDELTGPTAGVYHQGYDANGNPVSNAGPYQKATTGTMKAGQVLATSGNRDPGHLPWVDGEKKAYDPRAFIDVPCANGTNCLDENFCYDTRDCPDCEVCRNYECVQPDPNEACQSDRDCPCNPNEDQKWDCISGECKLTCRRNSDCSLLGRNVNDETGEEVCFACDPRSGYCGPGCNDDADCKSTGKAADRGPGTFCINCECKTPCDPPEFCKTDSDCKDTIDGEHQICEEHTGRVESDGADNTGRACVPGCRVDSDCPLDEFIDEDGKIWSQQQTCVETKCEALCSNDDDCFPGESCVGSSCQKLGALCVGTNDCEDDGEICVDGRCQRGCRSSSKCNEWAACPKEPRCLELCPYDQTCFCADCDEDDWSWIEKCPLDPACVAACPDEEGCEPPPAENLTCFQGECLNTCVTAASCPDGGKGWKCGYPPGLELEPPPEKPPGPCDDRLRSSEWVKPPKRCIKVESDDNGPVDDGFGCESTDCCDQAGQCAPCVCTTDEECPSGGVCQDGECAPGCDDENPCPEGQCCQNDGRCHLTCGKDSDCPDPEMCLQGGCCGIACEPLVFCNTNSDCPEGQYCDGDNVCQDGCDGDSDCEEDEICFQFGCEKACADSGDCNSNGECVSDDDCGDFETCSAGRCLLPAEYWTSVCNEYGFCESDPPTCCYNDGDCPTGQELNDEGEVVRTFKQICKDGQCSEGCRKDGHCPGGISCVDGDCKRVCYTDADCPGKASQCTEDSKAYREQLKEVAKCHKEVDKKEASGLYDPRTIQALRQQCIDQKEEVEKNRAQGYCQDINEGEPGEGGRTGCECFEECDQQGRCEPIQCAIDQDCPCGTCLTSGTCGDCWTDSDCPGRKKCDRPEICDDDGDNCVVDPNEPGTCVYGCLPPEPCSSNEDCPASTYCGRLPDDGPDGETQCITGCRDHSGCPPAMQCDSGRCAPECTSDDDCNTDYERCNGTSQNPGICIYTGWNCVSDGDCPPDLGYCRNGKCNPDSRCDTDDDCGGDDDDKCLNGFCSNADSEDPYDKRALFDPEAASDLGCESCADCCTAEFTCKPCPCLEHSDCPCGVCASNGTCKEECRSNADCIDGVCHKGECVECTTDSHCWARDYVDIPEGQRTLLQCSDNNVCETPCFNGLSSGSCFEGLQVGDTCQACPDKCPDGAACTTNPDRVCGLNRKWDPTIGDNGDWSYSPILCIECFMPCSATCDCPDGHICEDGGCITSSDKCTTSADCPCEAPDCRLGRCREIGDQCIGASDCEPKYDENDELIPQVCEFGNCKEGVCSEEYPCGGGQTCVDGQCFNSCNDKYLACGRSVTYNDDGIAQVKEVTCPPGYRCDIDRCVSEDYLGLGEQMGCGAGKFCDRGGCVPIEYGVNECGSDDDCNEPLIRSAYMNCRQQWGKNATELNRCVKETVDAKGRVCDERLCRKKNCFVATGDERDSDCDDNSSKGDGRDQEQDSCEPRGLCCGDNGFCRQCDCDEEHPCTERGTCCDQETGKCVDRSIHTNTKYGAPHECQFGKVFCELLDPEGNQINPSEDFNDPTVPGCAPEQKCVWNPYKGKEECEQIIRCWDGKPLSFAQVLQELEIVCDPDDEKCSDGCGDDMPPEEDECFFDTECGTCQICKQKFWRSDECCPLADIVKYYDEDGELQEVEIDGIYRNVCVAPYEDNESAEEKYCQCQSDDDCTECEYCDLTDNPGGGGGSNAIKGDETFGICKVECELCPCGGNSSTQEGACPSCSDRYGFCAIEGEKVLKEEYVDPNTGQVVPAETACACVIDRENDCCEAYDDVDHYESGELDTGCIRKEFQDQNGINKVKQVARCLDSEEGICAQCANDSDCGGYQVCRNGVCIGQCGQENSAAGEADYGFLEKDCTCCSDDFTCREIYESWTESKDGADGQICRPCTCTENGIDCADFIPCEGCYKWVRTDGSAQGRPNDELTEAQKKTQQFGLEQALFEEQLKEVEARNRIEELQEELPELEGEVGYWQAQMDICEEQCEEDPFDGELDCQGGREQVQHCMQVPAKLEAANTAVENQNNLITLAELDEYQAALNQGIINDKIAGTDFTYGSWTQVRQCECCVDGQCRSDEDCTYGTCFLCMEEWSGWYGVGIFGKVLENQVCMGMNSGYTSYGGWDRPDLASSCPCFECPDPGGDDAGPLCGNTCERSKGGPNFVHYEAIHGEDACIQYRCRDGIQTEERMGDVYQNRYFEYCSGSIIGCLIGPDSCRGNACCIARQYTNGWQFEYHLKEAGTFFGNYHLDTEDWIKLSGVNEEVIEAECLYPNRLGHVRGREVPTFEDMVAGHPCCNKGVAWYQCDPEHPGCQTLFRVHYQAGDVTGLIKRLYREVNALGLQIAYAALYWWQMEWEIEKIEGDIEELEKQADELFDQYKQLEGELNELIRQKNELEEEVKELDEKINNECATKEVFECERVCEDLEPVCREVCSEYTDCQRVWDEEKLEFVDECTIQETCTEICDPPEQNCYDDCTKVEVYKEDADNGLQCKWEHYNAERVAVGEEQLAAIEIRDELQADLNDAIEIGEIYNENFDNAKQAVKEQEAVVKNLEEAITNLERKWVELDCDGEGGETPACVNIDLQLNAPGGLYEQLDAANSALDDYKGQQELWFEEAEAQLEIVKEIKDELDDAQDEVDRLTQDYQFAYRDEYEARQELDEAIGELTEANTTLKQVNEDIEVKNEQIKELKEEIEVCYKVDCVDENGNVIVGPGYDCEECEGDNLLGEQVKKLEEVIESYRDEQKGLCDPGPAPEVPKEGGVIDVDGGSCDSGVINGWQKERENKKKQIKKLEEDDQKPTVPTLVTGGPPDDAKTSKELQEAYKEQLERDKEKLEDPWYPSGG